MIDPLLSNVLRLCAKAKKVTNTRIQMPFRHRRRAIKLTKEEREAQQKICDENRAKFHAALTEGHHTIMGVAEKLAEEFPGHDKDYYYWHLMQLPKVSEAKWPITEWQAYLHLDLKRRNKEIVELHGKEACHDHLSPKVVKEIANQWAKLTPEERTAITAETVKELEKRRENQLGGMHNTQLTTCHDAHVTLKKLKTEVHPVWFVIISYIDTESQLENLHASTGLAILFVATHGDIDAFGNPVVYHSDERVLHFMESTTGTTLEDTTLHLKAYCIAGLEGSTCKRSVIGRMNYNNFKGMITKKFGIVLKNWPIPKFQSPSSMSHMEAEMSFRAWESGTTHFHMLTNEEWAAWLNAWYIAPESTAEPTPIAASESLPSTPTAVTVIPTPVNTPAEATATPTTVDSSTAMTSDSPTQATTSVTMATEAPGATTQSQASPTEKRTADDADLVATPMKRACVEPMIINFVNSVTLAVGTTFVPPKATRKKRSDAGITRGPWKQHSPPTPENAAPADATTSTTVLKPHPCKKKVAATAAAESSPS